MAGVLLVVHGVAEHSGRYGYLVEHFVSLGFAVCGLDHIGHGQSEGPRAHVERFEDYVEPLRIDFRMVREWYPELPIYLVRHCMGGLISALYLLDSLEGLPNGEHLILGPRKYEDAENFVSNLKEFK